MVEEKKLLEGVGIVLRVFVGLAVDTSNCSCYIPMFAMFR
jgi:hypothetical protein